MLEDGYSGYQSNGLWNKYAERLDACDFFAGCGKKNGAVDFCAIAYCYWLFVNVITDDGNITDDDRKWATHYFMYQSDSCCTSAGCEQQAQVYKNNGAWFTDPKDIVVGDQVFFQRWDNDAGRYVYYHTGGCCDWGWNEGMQTEGVYVTEANVSGGKTEIRFYPYSEFGKKIAGFGHPRFDGYELTSNDDTVNAPANDTTPTPEPIDEYVKKTVCVNTYLAIRTEPEYKSDDSNKIGELYNGATVYIFETRDGWARIGDNMWVSVKYLRNV